MKIIWMFFTMCLSIACQQLYADTVVKYMSFSAQPDHIVDLKKMISAFEKQNPGIKVEFETVAWDSYFTKLQTLYASGTAPDTFELNYENFVTFASKGTLFALDGLISADKVFNRKMYNSKALEAFIFEGKQYALPESFSDVVFFYNKKLFDDAKLPYPDASWDWKKELEAAKMLTNPEKGIWGTYAPIQFWEFYKTIAQNGGSVMSPDGKTVVINSPQNVETLQFMIDKVNKYKVTPDEAQMSGQKPADLFMSGRIAMLRTGIWMMDRFKIADFAWDITLEPGNTQKAHNFFANAVAINSQSRNPDAAWKWIKFMTSDKEAIKIRVDSQWELPPVSDESVVRAYIEKTPPDNKKAVFEALDTLVVPPVIGNWAELTDVINIELDKARLGIKTPRQALDSAKKAIENMMYERE